jgi:hypothetical protein
MAMSTRHGKPRDPLKEQFWRRTIADQDQSDLTIKAYCQRNSLSPATASAERRVAYRTPGRIAHPWRGGVFAGIGWLIFHS